MQLILLCYKLKRFEERSATEINLRFTDSAANGEEPEPIRKKLRSSSDFSSSSAGPSTASTRSSSVFPVKCIFCKRERKNIKDRVSGKRHREALQQCELIKNEELLAAAELKQDEDLLRQIRGKDLVAAELRYHHTCKVSYTNFLRSKKRSEADSDIDVAAYSIFKKDIVWKRLIKGNEVMRMSKLAELYQNIIKSVEKADVVVRTQHLKQRISRDFPQLTFLKPRQRNQSEVVLCEKTVPDLLVTGDTDDSADESEIEEDAEMQQFEATGADEVSKRYLYHGSMYLRKQTVMSVKSPILWPPESKDITMERAMEIIPAELFNFLAWMCGSSDEVEVRNKFLDVSETDKRKLLAIAQDILHLAHRGGLILPKHYALGMTVRHWTGQSNLVGLLNGLGHSMSHSMVLELDTALAEKQISRSYIPEGFQKKTFTQLAWDNNDFGEETLSGKGTTHNTNGIIVQRLTTGHSLQTEETTMVKEREPGTRSKKRRVTVSEEPIPEYHASKRVGPPLSSTSNDNVMGVFANAELQKRFTSNIDLAMTMSKLHSKDAGHALPLVPGWTGFNVLLKSEEPVPPKSKVDQ